MATVEVWAQTTKPFPEWFWQEYTKAIAGIPNPWAGTGEEIPLSPPAPWPPDWIQERLIKEGYLPYGSYTGTVKVSGNGQDQLVAEYPAGTMPVIVEAAYQKAKEAEMANGTSYAGGVESISAMSQAIANYSATDEQIAAWLETLAATGGTTIPQTSVAQAGMGWGSVLALLGSLGVKALPYLQKYWPQLAIGGAGLLGGLLTSGGGNGGQQVIPGTTIALGGPGAPEPPAWMIVKEWNTGTARFYRLIDGRIAVRNKLGMWKIFRPHKNIVLSRNPRVNDLLRVYPKIDKLVGRLAARAAKRKHYVMAARRKH
jgi:hypothetical protein